MFPLGELFSTPLALSARPADTECTVSAERIVGGVRLTCGEGTVIELTAAECLAIAKEIGVVP